MTKPFSMLIFLIITSLLDFFVTTSSSESTSDKTTPYDAKSRIVTLDAKPQPITLDLTQTAVIVVDMQNDFVSKGGLFDHAGLDISMNQKAVGPTTKVLAAARQAGIKIIYLKMGFQPDLSDLGARDAVSKMRHRIGQTMRTPDGTEGRFLIRDTWNTDIVPELRPQAEDLVIYKHRFSGFYETDLDVKLRQMHAKYLIFTGVTTSICVESTLRDAMFRDYLPVILEDCVAEPIGHDLARSNHEASLFVIQTRFGWVSNSNVLIRILTGQSSASSQKQR